MNQKLKNELEILKDKLTKEAKLFVGDDKKFEDKMIAEDIENLTRDLASGNLSKEDVEIVTNTIAMLVEIKDTKKINNFFQSCLRIIEKASFIMIKIVISGGLKI